MIDEAVLEERLRDLGRRAEYPATPALAAAVRARLVVRPVPWWRTLRVRAAAALVVLAALVLGIAPVRTAVAGWLGIHGVVVTPVRSLPPLASPSAPSGTPSLLPGVALQLGQPLSLEAARAALSFPVAVPALLGAPDEVFVRTDAGGIISLVYRARPGLPASAQTGVAVLVTEFRGDLNPQLIQKFIDPGTVVTPVSVGGGAGLWFDSAPHGLFYDIPGSTDGYSDTPRLAGPVLVFERGQVTVRIEGPAPEQQALDLAGSMR